MLENDGPVGLRKKKEEEQRDPCNDEGHPISPPPADHRYETGYEGGQLWSAGGSLWHLSEFL